MKPTVKRASTQAELDAIFELRYLILRKPWNQPLASASDELESKCVNAYLSGENGEILACGRLQENEGKIGQIRYMAVRNDLQGQGFGKQILSFLEEEAIKLHLEKIQLQARENALQFYKMQSYQFIEPSFKLWDQIQHYLMEKQLKTTK